MVAERVQIRVILRPAPIPERVGHGLIQTIDGLIGLPLQGVDAGDVVKNAAILGVDGESAAGPIQAAGAFAQLAEGIGAQIEGARAGVDLCGRTQSARQPGSETALSAASHPSRPRAART
jgi:hypothetical protein